MSHHFAASECDAPPDGSVTRPPSAVWMVWRVHRFALLAVAGTVLLLTAGLLAFRSAVGDVADGRWCSDVSGCAGLIVAGLRIGDLIPMVTLVLLVLPTATGALLGALGVAREAERGTLALALTQGVTTRRWWLTTLALLAGPLALAWAGVGLLARWAFEPVQPFLRSAMTTPFFETSGPVLGAFFLLAFVVSAALGAWRRATIVALVGSVVGCALLVLVGLASVRSHYAEPTTVVRPLTDIRADGTSPTAETNGSAWELDVSYVAPDGRSMDSSAIRCAGDVPEEPFDTFWERCLVSDGYVDEVTVFHAGGQWLRFQATEGAIVLSLAGVVGWLGFRGLRRRPD
ncbi:hypothetical protein FDO65_09880 [Nakamurella flava]|uniref:ABC transporter permease n=1 Tax=Nakamurella flava TaxID=2576308 RepID=A0A4U6QP33_9ACTN|nr:hypothetical protein [Nakamurella flava]TKV61826.1 hypothetical protein FDO65_09880 [Nakamurella flava]